MPKFEWSIYNVTQDFLIGEFTQSMSFSWGRDSPVTPYQGRTATITMLNDANQSQYVSNADQINIILGIDTEPTSVIIFNGIVVSREFQDTPGNGAGSTLVFTVLDLFAMAGTVQFNGTVSSAQTQLLELGASVVTANAADLILLGTTDVSITTGTIAENALSRINQIILADKGYISSWLYDISGTYYTEYQQPSNQSSSSVVASPTYGRTSSATQIAYDSIVRREAATSNLFYNRATVTGTSATVTSDNTPSLLYYGVRSFTTSTPQSNFVTSSSQWFANAYSDPEAVTLEISFLDVAQTSDALLDFAIYSLQSVLFQQVSYTPPGGSSTSGYYLPEKITMNVTPAATRVSMTMIPITLYQFFKLNDSVFGVLDTSRLGAGEI